MLRALFRPARPADDYMAFLRDQLAVLDKALEAKARPLRPEDFPTRTTGLKVTRPWEGAE